MPARLSVRFGLVACFTAALIASRANAAPPTVGSPAPAIQLNTLDHKSVTLADITKGGPAVVVVLRGWPGYQCPLCQKQYGSFRTQADAFAKAGVPVLLIYPGPAAKLEEHAAEFVGASAIPAGFTLAVDPDYTFTNAWGLRWDKAGETAHPATFVVDAKGVIRFAKVSEIHGDRSTPEAALAAAKSAATRPAAE